VQESLTDTIKDVDWIVTALPKTEHVEAALIGEGGIFEFANKGTYICDTSTISPVASADFHAQALKRNMVFLDTPMSGGINGAHAGTLTFMVGGEAEQFEYAKHMLSGMGTNFFHCGKAGSGEIAKLVNNLILGITMVGVSEGFAIGEKLGVDPKVLQQICAVSTSRSWVMDTYHPRPGVLPNVPSSKGYEGGFGVSLIKKDLALAVDAAVHAKADHALTDFTIDYFRELEKKGFGGKDFGYVYQYIMKNRNL
jgi:3-hydroxyisobutyrate dehydrogenase